MRVYLSQIECMVTNKQRYNSNTSSSSFPMLFDVIVVEICLLVCLSIEKLFAVHTFDFLAGMQMLLRRTRRVMAQFNVRKSICL